MLVNRCISFRDSACRCFGYAVSKKRFVYTIDDDCFVAKDPNGEPVSHHSCSLHHRFCWRRACWRAASIGDGCAACEGSYFLSTHIVLSSERANARAAQIDALKQHITNLTTPSTPFFFNTLYDPYAEVRRMPFTLYRTTDVHVICPDITGQVH